MRRRRKDGKPVYTNAWGEADRDAHRRNSLDTDFDVGSLGKMFTAVAVAQLVEVGKLGFDDPVRRYVPELPRAAGAATIADLLTHTAGFGDYFSHPGTSRSAQP